MKKLFTLLTLSLIVNAKAQTLYFPPTSGTTWDTISPASLGWCQTRIDTLYNYLNARHTKAFIILQDGKIVLEHYFGTFTVDSTWYWASASKSLTSTLTGIAHQENLLNITDTVSNFLGNGWTSCITAQERKITIFNLLTMTSGLNDTISTPCTNEDTAASCLQYLAPAGTRWAYHTGAYRKLEDVVSTASGISYNAFTNNRIGSHIGMTGAWIVQEYYSKPRSMARFGLLALNKGIWANDTILYDTAYFNAMTNTSQNFNLSYGYLWWLNGKSSHMAPGLQLVIPQQLIPNAPADLFAALGKNDQKIYVVPSRNMVVIRMGNAAYSSALASTQFDNELWQYIDSLNCSATDVNEPNENKNSVSIFPNPAQNIFTIEFPHQNFSLEISDVLGRIVCSKNNIPDKTQIDCSNFQDGLYFIRITTANQKTFNGKILIAKYK